MASSWRELRIQEGKLDKLLCQDEEYWKAACSHFIMHCISSVTYSYLINGKVRGFLKPSRGLCQGDPLSPYLFLLLIKVVIQAMPTYSMNLFRLPQTLILDLHRLMARFWWGSSASSIKIHWSILWGRFLLEKGLRWHIGRGEAVSIYHDNWIPRPFFFKARPPFVLSDNARVSLLKRALGEWDTKLVRDSFPLEDADFIVAIPFSSRQDALCWYFDKMGKFFVKSAYWIASHNLSSASSSSIAPMSSWWRFLWHLNIPPKVRFFLWRSCNDWLPSAGSLVRRHIAIDGFCQLCSSGFESSVHAFWGCPLLKAVRKSRPCFVTLRGDFHGLTLGFLALCKASLVRSDFEDFYIII
ncbi:hypothetical protein ACOSQ2_021118 [Xanthoceras sorbifolium]